MILPILLSAAHPATFACHVTHIVDGDTWSCSDKTRIRIAGVNSREAHGNPCPRGRPCPDMSAAESTRVLRQVIAGRTLRCRKVGVSYDRTVATCTVGGEALRCALLARGSVAVWDRYVTEYGLERCKR